MLVLGIALATVAALAASLVFYAVAPPAPGQQAAKAASERPKPWQVVAELVRSALVACLVAGLLAAGGWGTPFQGATLGLALWVLPVVLLAGSVLWEKVPVRSAALHSCDWLIKLVTIGAIVGAFV